MPFVILKSATKDVMRTPRRTLVIVTVIALAISNMVIFTDIQQSVSKTESVIYYEDNIADILVLSQDSFFSKQIIEQLKSNISTITELEPRIIVFGTTFMINNSIAHVVIEGLPSSPPNINRIRVNDSVWNTFIQDNGCLVEKGGGEYLGLSKSDSLEVLAEQGILNFTVQELVEIPWTNSYTTPRRLNIFVPLEHLQDSLNTSSINALRIKISEFRLVNQVYDEIIDFFEKENITIQGSIAEVGGIRQLTSDVKTLFMLLSYPGAIITTTIFITIIFQFINIEYREIGMRKAIGFTRRDILKLYLYRSLLWFCLGSILGILISKVLINSMLQVFLAPILGNINFSWNVTTYLPDLIFLFVLVVLGTTLPALNASNISTIEAIKFGLHKIRYSAKQSKLSKLPVNALFSIRFLKRKKVQTTFLVIGLIVSMGLAISIFSIANTSRSSFISSFTDTYNYDALINVDNTVNLTQIQNVKELTSIKHAEGYFWGYGDRLKSSIVFDKKQSKLEPESSPLVIGKSQDDLLFTPSLVKGEFPAGDINQIAISLKLSKIMGAAINDNITINLELNNKWNLNGTYTIVGILDIQLQDGLVFIFDINNLKTIILNSSSSIYNTIAIKSSNESAIDPALNDCLSMLQKDGTGVSFVLTTADMSKSMFKYVNALQFYLLLITIMILITIIIGIINFGLSNYFDRRDELILYKAIGATKKDIASVFIFDTVIITLIYSIPAILFSVWATETIKNLANNSTFPIWLNASLSLGEIVFILLVPALVFLFLFTIITHRDLYKKSVRQIGFEKV